MNFELQTETQSRGCVQRIVRQIIEALKADPRRDIYEAGSGWKGNIPSGEYWITYQGGGPFPKDVVVCMFKSCTLVRRYPDCECYHLAND